MQVVNIDALQRDYDKRANEAAALLAKTARECQAHEEKDKDGKVIANGRLMTTEEKAAIRAIIEDANSIKAKIAATQGESHLQAEIARLTAGMNESDAETVRRDVRKSLGQQWVDSDAGQYFLKKQHHGTRNWASPVAELYDPYKIQATTLTEGVGSGGKLILPDYRPGIMPLLFKKLTIRDLLAPGTTNSTSIIYMIELTFTNAAAAVAEGAVKPESALVFDQKTDPVVKLAHWIPTTEEMLEDVSQIRSYIDARLRLGLQLTEEDQLLNGDGILPNLLGIMNRPGLAAPVVVGVAPDTGIEAIYRQMMAIFGTSFVPPDGIVMNPANWSKVALTKDTTGNYMGGGPFTPAVAPSLWGLPVDVTPSIVAGTSLVGAFSTQAQIFDRGGVRVEASNSHQDFFIKNLVAIRAEERLALAVYRPGAFGKVTGLP
jgi:HK97 family phage major capsid protein